MKIPKQLQDRIYWINPNLKLNEHANRISFIDLLVSDLDDTIAPCTAKEIVLEKIVKQPYNLFNPKMLDACASYIFNGFKDKAKSIAWQKYKRYFLNTNEERSKISQKYTEEYAKSTLFPGFLDFLSLLPENTVKIYLTGNISEIIEGYIKATGFNEAISDQFNKEKGIKKVTKRYPNKKRILFSANDPEDEAALDFLKYKKTKGEIEYVYSLYVTKSPNRINERYDINIAQIYTGLNELFRNVKNHPSKMDGILGEAL